MKALVVLILFCTVSQAAPAGAEVAQLLAELPPQRALREAQDMVVSIEGAPPRGAAGKSSEDLAAARALIEKARTIIPKVRRLITVGSSVFDYPGLLAHGDISWSEVTQEYEVYLGVYLRGVEGKVPYDFKIVFDAKGVIKRVKDVVWKH